MKEKYWVVTWEKHKHQSIKGFSTHEEKQKDEFVAQLLKNEFVNYVEVETCERKILKNIKIGIDNFEEL